MEKVISNEDNFYMCVVCGHIMTQCYTDEHRKYHKDGSEIFIQVQIRFDLGGFTYTRSSDTGDIMQIVYFDDYHSLSQHCTWTQEPEKFICTYCGEEIDYNEEDNFQIRSHFSKFIEGVCAGKNIEREA